MTSPTRRPKTLHFWRGDLPHWQVEDGRYFVTIHLKNAIPEAGRLRLRQLIQQFHDEPLQPGDAEAVQRRSRIYFQQMELWLDRSSDTAHLRHQELANMVVEAIDTRCRRGIWQMFRFVVMPSHLHLFLELDPERSLKRELSEFKRWTGHRATRLNPQLAGHRFWQTEWFDHWSRSDEQDERIVAYIDRNPLIAGLVRPGEVYPWIGGEAVLRG